MFARFQVPLAAGQRDDDKCLLKAAQELSQGDDVSGSVEHKLSTLIDWFEEALETPGHGLAWFKASAEQHLSHAHDLAQILEDHGYKVTMITTDNPGQVLYEDDHQVVAKPAALTA